MYFSWENIKELDVSCRFEYSGRNSIFILDNEEIQYRYSDNYYYSNSIQILISTQNLSYFNASSSQINNIYPISNLGSKIETLDVSFNSVARKLNIFKITKWANLKHLYLSHMNLWEINVGIYIFEIE